MGKNDQLIQCSRAHACKSGGGCFHKRPHTEQTGCSTIDMCADTEEDVFCSSEFVKITAPTDPNAIFCLKKSKGG